MSRICIYSTIESATNIFPELRPSRLLQSLMATSGTHVFLYIQESLKRAHLYNWPLLSYYEFKQEQSDTIYGACMVFSLQGSILKRLVFYSPSQYSGYSQKFGLVLTL